PTVEENGVIRTKKYVELSAAKKIQADCDMQATNIILQGLPADIYSLMNHHKVAKDLWERVQLLMQGFVVPVFSPGDDPIAYLNKAMTFLTTVASSSNATSSGGNNASRHARVVKFYNCKAQKAGPILDEEQLTFLVDLGVPDGQVVQTIIPKNAAFETELFDTYDSDCDDISHAKAILMANISNYGSDVISENSVVRISQLLPSLEFSHQNHSFSSIKIQSLNHKDMSTSKTYQQSLADAGSETRPPMPERGPYQFQMFVPSDSTVPKLQTAEDLQGDALLHYDAEMEFMNLILLSIPNEIYNSVDACITTKEMWKRVERLMRGTIQNQVDRETYFTNEFDQFVVEPGEALVSVYNRFAQLMNDLE
ncbi:hypothetical protein Tco_1040595, partial [Tanacetum coccineum]